MTYMDYIATNTANTSTITRESLMRGFENLKKMDERISRERAERGRILREEIAERGIGGPIQQQLDSIYLRSGPLFMSPQMADALQTALDLERAEA